MFPSIRAQLTAGLALLITLCLVAFAIYLYVAIAHSLADEQDEVPRVQAQQRGESRHLPGRGSLLCRGPGRRPVRVQRPLGAVQLRRASRGGGAMSMRQDLVEAREVTLLDLVDRAIDHGVILAGDITISVADVDLIYLGLRVLLASVERTEELRAGRERAVEREDLTVSLI